MNCTIFKYWLDRKNKEYPAGFTLIELIVVIVIIGILAAIATPGWIGFINNRRVNSANDVVLQALNEAKNKARKEKRAYSVSFRTENSMPQIAIHPANIDASDNTQVTAMQNYWKFGDLSQDVDIKANQILMRTNLGDLNEKAGSWQTLPDAPSTPTSSQTITFEHTGELADRNSGETADTGLVIQVAVPNAATPTDPITNTIRCIQVQTLLGSLVIGRGDTECQAS